MSQIRPTKMLSEWRESAPYWEKHAHTIRTMFEPVTRALIDSAEIGKGRSVLDVAAGTGEPALTIAEVVGPTGSVACTDPVAEMIAAAGKEARRRGLTNVSFRQCVAESLPFETGAFDAVVSRLGVMFFADPIAGLREMVRVTKVGCALALAVWDRSDLNPYMHIVDHVISRYDDTTTLDPDPPGSFRFADRDKLSTMLCDAGADWVQQNTFEFKIEAPISLEEFWDLRVGTSATLRQKVAGLPPEQARRAAIEAMGAVRRFFADNQMSFPAQMFIVIGRKMK